MTRSSRRRGTQAVAAPSPDHWGRYNRAQEGRSTRASCLAALQRAGAGDGRVALDLGAGAGIETAALLRAGWTVFAVDAEPGSAETIARTVGGALGNGMAADAVARRRLTVVEARLEAARYPRCELAYAGFSLPFVPPSRFEEAWARITGALRPGGWLAVDLFGERDDWAQRPDITTHTRGELDALLAGLQVHRLTEEEHDGRSFLGPKHWHSYGIIARKP